jgi:anti-sigma regulatory factor (Ser/Thr protein kinase)
MVQSDELVFRAESASVPRARHAVTGFARQHGVPSTMLGGIALAVSEACSNVVLHAYRKTLAPGDFSVDVALGRDSVRVRVRDHGLGMTPRIDSPGVGLGLPIIASTADAFTVAPCEGGGTELRMRFDFASV